MLPFMEAISGPQSIAKVYVDKHDSKEQCIVNLIVKKNNIQKTVHVPPKKQSTKTATIPHTCNDRPSVLKTEQPIVRLYSRLVHAFISTADDLKTF